MSLDYLTIFGAGLVTFLTPCVLPMIPVYLAALIGGDLKNLETGQRGQLLVRSLLFSLGFLLVFVLMGLGASAIGAALIEQRTILQLAGSFIILLFALKFLGVIQIPLMDRIVKANDSKVQTKFGSVNAIIMGVVFAAGWSPCVGPVLGSVLTYTAGSTSDPLIGALYLGIYGVGFAIPLILAAAFAETGTRWLRKLGPQLSRIERVTGIVLVAAALLMFTSALPEPVQGGQKSLQETANDQIQGQNNSISDDNLLVQNAQQNQNGQTEQLPMMIELYSSDCSICKKMRALVDSIIAQCDKKGVRVTMVDVSLPENRHLATTYRLIGVPTFIFLDAKGEEVSRLVGEQNEKTLKRYLSILRGEECPGVGHLGSFDEGSYSTDEDNPTCQSMNTFVTDVRKPLNSSDDLMNPMTPNVPNAETKQGNCSPDLP